MHRRYHPCVKHARNLPRYLYLQFFFLLHTSFLLRVFFPACSWPDPLFPSPTYSAQPIGSIQATPPQHPCTQHTGHDPEPPLFLLPSKNRRHSEKRRVQHRSLTTPERAVMPFHNIDVMMAEHRHQPQNIDSGLHARFSQYHQMIQTALYKPP